MQSDDKRMLQTAQNAALRNRVFQLVVRAKEVFGETLERVYAIGVDFGDFIDFAEGPRPKFVANGEIVEGDDFTLRQVYARLFLSSRERVCGEVRRTHVCRATEPGLCRLLHLPVVYARSEHRNPLVSAALPVGVKLPHASAQVQDEEVFGAVCEQAGSAGLHSEQTTERESFSRWVSILVLTV